MINISNSNNNDHGFVVKKVQLKTGQTSNRISTTERNKLRSRKADLGMGYGKSVYGILSAAVPASLYKEIMNTARDEKINLSDIIRRGVMREIGAIRLSRSLKLDPTVYGAGKPNDTARQDQVDPQVAANKKANAVAIAELRKTLKRLTKR